MHGVGAQWIARSFKAFGHKALNYVPSQRLPDPEFPTVSFPNPEEKGALNEAMQFADEKRCTLIIANDPDADRLAVAEKNVETGEWKVFSGNEIGILLGAWQIQHYERAHPDGPTPAVLASVVSSRMLKAMAKKDGIIYHDTLTGTYSYILNILTDCSFWMLMWMLLFLCCCFSSLTNHHLFFFVVFFKCKKTMDI